MRILLCQINPTIGDFAGNAAKIRDGIAAGRSDGVDLVLFPELSLSGYPPEDLLLHDDCVARCEEELQKLIPETKGVAAAVGLPRRLNGGQEKALGNSAAIISDGKLLGYYDKVLLPTYDIFDERRYFDAGEHVPTWEIAGERVAVTICEDIWQHSEVLRWSSYDRDPIAELIAHTPDVVVNLSASPFSTDKPVLRADVCRRAAKTLGCPVVMCNQVGANDSLIFDGHSTHADAQGRVVAYADGFVEQNLVVDTGAQGVTEGSPVFASDPTASLHDALVLGIRDYFHKQGFKKACIGLSGGIDSTVVAVLAVEALGADNVLGITMPSRYSSEGSVADSQALAKNLGIDCWELPIEAPFASFFGAARAAFRRTSA